MMPMPQKTILFLFILCLAAACRQKNGEEHPIILYPELPTLSTRLDTSFSPPVAVPYDTLYQLDALWQQNWLDQQIRLSQQRLPVDPSLPTVRKPDRLDRFPQQTGETYYSLGYLDGQYSLLKGDDISTPQAYQFYLKSAGIPNNYNIYDFQVFDQEKKVALLLERADGFFSPALWFPQKDSLHIWKNIKGTNHWLLTTDQQELLILDNKAPILFKVDLDSGGKEIINLPFPSATSLRIVGQLQDQSLLFKYESRGQAIQYWCFQAGAWSLRFEFPTSWCRWLGQTEDNHYFLSDLKMGQTGIFSAKADTNDIRTRQVIHPGRSPIVTAILTNNTLFTLEEKTGKGEVKAWSTEGLLQAIYPLPATLQSLDFHYYPESNNLLVRQMDPIGGIRYIVINPAYTQPIEIVHQSLDQSALPPMESSWQYINSYDGAAVPIMIVKSKGLPQLRSAPSLFIPMPDKSEDLLRFQADLAISHQVLKQGGICIFVFTRGTRHLGKEGYQQGTGPNLQLAFDDLQAALAYCNFHHIGARDQRSVWTASEQALNGAALLVQRPDLAKAIYLYGGSYDLRTDFREEDPFFLGSWWNRQDSIPDRLLPQYSPYLSTFTSNNGPRIMIQSANPYIFGPASVFLARLQQEMPEKEKLWGPFDHLEVKKSDLERKKWENQITHFLLDTY